MYRRYFAHAIFCGDRVFYKEVAELTFDGFLIGTFSFERETAFTSYFDGLLLLMQPGFAGVSAEFADDLRSMATLKTRELLLPYIIFEHPLYQKYKWCDGVGCDVFQLTPVDWVNNLISEQSHIKGV